jgi:hypothetical protein
MTEIENKLMLKIVTAACTRVDLDQDQRFLQEPLRVASFSPCKSRNFSSSASTLCGDRSDELSRCVLSESSNLVRSSGCSILARCPTNSSTIRMAGESLGKLKKSESQAGSKPRRNEIPADTKLDHRARK